MSTSREAVPHVGHGGSRRIIRSLNGIQIPSHTNVDEEADGDWLKTVPWDNLNSDYPRLGLPHCCVYYVPRDASGDAAGLHLGSIW